MGEWRPTDDALAVLISMQQYATTAIDYFRAATEPNEREYLESLARRLYVLAWIIEGVAVALGLGMALSLNWLTESSFTEFLLGGGGFVMVACAELSKIPWQRSSSKRLGAGRNLPLLASCC